MAIFNSFLYVNQRVCISLTRANCQVQRCGSPESKPPDGAPDCNDGVKIW